MDDLVTPRLRLEPLRPDHADEMVAVLADPSLYAFTGGEPPSIDALRDQYVRQARGRSADGTETWHNWIVRLADQAGTPIGVVQATVVDSGADADIAWIVGVPWQGMGYATEAAGSMVDWLAARGVRTITAHIHPGHEASAGVAARLGLEATDVVDDGEVVWRRAIEGPPGSPSDPDDPRRRARVSRLSVGVGVALIGFALFEVVFVRAGALPGDPDQVVRDVLLVAAGIAMLVSGLLPARRRGNDQPGG